MIYICGIAIETNFEPPCVCLFMARIENNFLDSDIVKPWFWLRYIDGIFFTWTEGEDKLEEFLNRFNNFHPKLTFTHEKSKSSVNYLDVSVSTVDRKLKTDLFCKPTDCHSFLHFNSAYPFLNKKSIVCIQGLGMKMLCSSQLTFQKHVENLKTWFCNRGKGIHRKL